MAKIDNYLFTFSNSYNISIVCEVKFMDTQFTLFEDLEPTMENSVPVSFEVKLIFELDHQTIKYFRIVEDGSFWDYSEYKFRIVSLRKQIIIDKKEEILSDMAKFAINWTADDDILLIASIRDLKCLRNQNSET